MELCPLYPKGLFISFNVIYDTPISGKYFFCVLFWKNLEKYGKTAVFPGGYGRIGEIPHGRLRPDWGLLGLRIARLPGAGKT